MIAATSTVVRMGFSPCPNDTFMFHGLVSGQIPLDGIVLSPVIEDIEALNQRAVSGRGALSMTKLSVTALGHVSDRYEVLRSGAALGRGCGPIVVGRPGGASSLAQLAGQRVGIPGRLTTAHLLLRIFCPADVTVVPMRFEAIMPAVARGELEAGVIIHEGRFTYAAKGLRQIVDLGERWERDTGLPIPLGVICVARTFDASVTEALDAGLRRSIELAMREPHRSSAFIRRHAAEMDAAVCRQHIGLYVNDFSIDMGESGRAAVDQLLARGRAIGLIPVEATPSRP